MNDAARTLGVIFLVLVGLGIAQVGGRRGLAWVSGKLEERRKAQKAVVAICFDAPHESYLGCREWVFDSLRAGIPVEKLVQTLRAATEDTNAGRSGGHEL